MSKEYIERGALLKVFDEKISQGADGYYCYLSNGGKVDYATQAELDTLNYSCELIKQAPAADVVEVKHGEWEFGELDVLGAPVKCSRCGFGVDRADPILWLDYDGHKFCGNCGAKMDGGADNG